MLISAANDFNMMSLFVYYADTAAMEDLLVGRDPEVIENAFSGKISGDGRTITCYYERFGQVGGLVLKKLDGTRIRPTDIVVPVGTQRDATLPGDISDDGTKLLYQQPFEGLNEMRVHLYGGENETSGSYIDRSSAPVSMQVSPAGHNFVVTFMNADTKAPIPGVWSWRNLIL